MAKYIELEAAIKALCNCKPHTCSIDDCEKGCQEVSAICAIPVADVVERKHGKWIDYDGNPVPWDEQNKNCPCHGAYCSECGEWLTASDEYPVIGNFCPNCGARMDGEGNV